MKTTATFLSLALLLPACGQYGNDELDGMGDASDTDASNDDAEGSDGEGDGGGAGHGGGDHGGDGADDDGADDDGADDDGADDDGADDDGADDDGADDGEAGDELECTSTVVPLIAGQTYEAGMVEVATTDQGLSFRITTEGAWRLERIHAYAGIDLPPNNGSAMIPGQFPFAQDLDAADHFAFTIPFEAVLGGVCGEDVLVAVHAEVTGESEDGLCEQTAWGEGPFGIGAASWGTVFETELCCNE